MSDNLFLEYRIQHTFHSCLYVLDGLINNSIQTKVYSLLLCNRFCSSIWPYVKSDNDRIRCACQRYIRFIDGTYASVDHLYYHFLVRQFYQALFHCLYRALNICFNDNRKLFQITSLDLTEQIIQRHL